jgi:hypothetical protein
MAGAVGPVLGVRGGALLLQGGIATGFADRSYESVGESWYR